MNLGFVFKASVLVNVSPEVGSFRDILRVRERRSAG
jgi:hypothetical protein